MNESVQKKWRLPCGEVPSTVTSIRKKVFTEVARLAYEGGDYTRMEKLPYVISPGEVAAHRESIFLERAIAGERVRGHGASAALRPGTQYAV